MDEHIARKLANNFLGCLSQIVSNEEVKVYRISVPYSLPSEGEATRVYTGYCLAKNGKEAAIAVCKRIQEFPPVLGLAKDQSPKYVMDKKVKEIIQGTEAYRVNMTKRLELAQSVIQSLTKSVRTDRHIAKTLEELNNR